MEGGAEEGRLASVRGFQFLIVYSVYSLKFAVALVLLSCLVFSLDFIAHGFLAEVLLKR